MRIAREISLLLATCTLAWIGNAQVPDKPVSSAKPILPFVQKDVCPFECCTYRKWTAQQSTTLYNTWKRSGRKAIGAVRKADAVRASTGVVVTYRPGKFKAREEDSALGVKKGDEVLVYSYRGEGYYDFWSNGKLYKDQIEPDASCDGKKNENMFSKEATLFCSLDEGEHEWWAFVKTKTGLSGWVNMNHARFSNVDACG